MNSELILLGQGLFSSAVIVCLFMTFVYLIGLIKKDNGIVDIAWGIGFSLIAVYTYLNFAGSASKQLLITLLVLIWGSRLALYIALRNKNKGEDKRYADFRKRWKKYWPLQSYLKIYMLQGLLMLLISLPIIIVNTLGSPQLFLINIIGILLWEFGFIFETIADMQMLNFKSNKANKGKILKTGLWRYSRHPNYFGEAVAWWGIFLITIGSPIWWIALISPVLITYLLLKVSGVTLLEKNLSKRKGYQEYINETSAFLPLPPKTADNRYTDIVLPLSIVFAVMFCIVPFLTPLPYINTLSNDELDTPGATFIQIEGIKTLYLTAGPVDGETVILIHGFGGNAYDWRKTIPYLADLGYRVYALDLKGFGLADKKLEENYSHSAQASFVVAFMDKLGIEKASIVGHSMGGNVSAHAVQRYPERFTKLILVSAAVVENSFPIGINTLLQNEPFVRWGRILLRTFVNEDTASNLLEDALYIDTAIEKADLNLHTQMLRTANWELALIGIIRDSGNNALPKGLDTITIDTGIIWGEKDSWVPPSSGESLNERIPNSTYSVIPDAGHLPMLEKSDEFNKLLSEKLENEN